MGDLTKNFSISEIFGDNEPTAMQYQTARRMAVTLLQPIRSFLSYSVKVTSGYRSPEHNAKIGGSPTSEHTWQWYAGATDLSIISDHDRLRVYDFLMKECKHGLGQCIWYLETTHLHISIATAKRNGDFLICTSKKDHQYRRVLSIEDIINLDERLS